ncbi:MAG: sodium:solute symporter family protein [Chlorobiota bacterium]
MAARTMMELTAWDWGIVGAYVVGLVLVGFGVARRPSSEHHTEAEEFLVAGRRLTLPLFVATLVATWYGAILGVGEFVYRYGIVAWLCIAVPYYVVALLFAATVAGRIRASQTLSIPEQMGHFYGEGVARVAAGVVLIVTVPAAYLLMVATLVRALTGWSLEACLVLGALFSVAYLYTGGFYANVLTNALQFVLMYGGFAALAYFSWRQFGTPEQMWSLLPPTHRSIPGLLGWGTVAVWWVIALQTFVDPNFYQRCAAARSVKTAQWGIALSVLFWLAFDTLSITAALYARAFISTEPLNAYPALADAVLPAGWKGMFVVALLATVMSTLESYAFVSAATFGRDILGRIPSLAARYSVRRLTQVGLVLSVTAAGVLAWAIPSAVELILRTASVAVPALLFPFVLGYAARCQLPSKWVGWLMGMTASSSLGWMVLREARLVPIGLQWIEPAFVGILFGAVMSLFWRQCRPWNGLSPTS